jgi:hypothetical protein
MAAAKELLRKGPGPFLLKPSHKQRLRYVAAFMYDYVILTIL